MKSFQVLITIACTTLLFLSSCKKELYITDSGNLVPKTVDENASLPSIAINNTLLHTETFGNPDSAIIVMLHGGPGADYRYMLNCAELAQDGYFIVFYDQRGSGLSKRHDADIYSIQIFLDDLSAVIDYYRSSPTQQVFFLGHSWGAMLATAYINKYPTEISGAVLAEPGGFTWEQTLEYLDGAFPSDIFSETLNDAVYFEQFITGDEHAVLDYKLSIMAASDGANDNNIGNSTNPPFWRSGAVVNSAMLKIGENEGFDFTTNLINYNLPVLFAYSENNKAYGYTHALNVASAYPIAQIIQIDDAGHDDMVAAQTGWQNLYNVALPYYNSLKN